MIVYISAFVITVAIGLIADVTASRSNKVCATTSSNIRSLHSYALFCAPIPLLFVTCLRYGVGFDYFPTYVTDYYSFKEGHEIHSDFGFNFFYAVSQSISSSPQMLFIITGAIFVLGFYISSYLISGSVALPTALLFLSSAYVKGISMIAQYTAVVLLLLSFAIYFGRKQFVHARTYSTILLIIAPTLHVSALFPAIVLLFLYYYKKIDPTIIFKIATALPIVTLIFEPFILQIVLFLTQRTRFGVYIDSQFVGIESESILYIEILIFLVMWFIMRDKYKGCSRALLYILLMESICLSCALLQAVPLMFRITFYFSAFNIIGLPPMLQRIRQKWIKLAVTGFILIALAIWFYLYPYPKNTDGFLPYAFSFAPYTLYN